MLEAAPVRDTNSCAAKVAYRNRLLIMAHPEGGQKVGFGLEPLRPRRPAQGASGGGAQPRGFWTPRTLRRRNSGGQGLAGEGSHLRHATRRGAGSPSLVADCQHPHPDALRVTVDQASELARAYAPRGAQLADFLPRAWHHGTRSAAHHPTCSKDDVPPRDVTWASISRAPARSSSAAGFGPTPTLGAPRDLLVLAAGDPVALPCAGGDPGADREDAMARGLQRSTSSVPNALGRSAAVTRAVLLDSLRHE